MFDNRHRHDFYHHRLVQVFDSPAARATPTWIRIPLRKGRALMRWKLLIGLAITWFGLGFTGLFQYAGIIPLDTPLFWTLMEPAMLEVLLAMSFLCTGKCVDGF